MGVTNVEIENERTVDMVREGQRYDQCTTSVSREGRTKLITAREIT